MNNIKRVTLEMSLKPFKTTDRGVIEKVCETAFEQWKKLLVHADEVGVMLWTADGSEILEYRGNMDDRLEWAHYIGGANTKMDWDRKNDPDGIGLHTRCYEYADEIPEFTYGDLKDIISILKKVGTRVTGKPVFVGETFDPGPEFAKSEFKYVRHNEVCEGGSMGAKSMVCCYNTLNAEDRAYAAYPDGIPQDTPFGTFLGKQSQLFLSDMGFDYIWFSNGFGFGVETWGVSGALFDGKRFYPEKIDDTHRKISNFWDLFTAECSFPIQTRGTNLTVGTDFASDGVDHEMIYKKLPDLLPPPNSPWAALDGNFGLELTGYMSRAAELPGDDFLFRFYVHDIWWLNSPWIDRYEGQPHDIYLPTATARIDKDGKTVVANHINFLSIDDSYGNMPERCPNEVIPHILSCYQNAPDEASPFVWVYPFREYSTLASGRLEKLFYEDWYITAAINHGFPLNTVVSTDNFVKLYNEGSKVFENRVLVSPVPENGSVVCDTLARFVKNGGKVMLYGSLKGCDPKVLDLLGLKQTDELCGEMTIVESLGLDGEIENGSIDYNINYGGIFTDGGVDTVIGDDGTVSLAEVTQGENKRVIASCKSFGEGKAIWCRGCDCSRKPVDDNDAAKKDDTAHFDSFPAEILMRKLAAFAGYDFTLKKYDKFSAEPVILMHRCRKSLWFDGYCPDTTVEIGLRTPLGAPLLLGCEALYKNGATCYHLPRAWKHECRIFVEDQQGGMVRAKELISNAYGIERRMIVEGLKNATVYVIPKESKPEKSFCLVNSNFPHFVCPPFKSEVVDSLYGPVYKLSDITGSLVVSDYI